MITTGANLPAVAFEPGHIEEAIQKLRRLKGRPTIYSPELAGKVLALMSEGEPITKICKRKDMPAWGTVWDWICKIEDFASSYHRVRTGKASLLAEKGVETLQNASTESMAHVRKAEALANYSFGLAKCYDRETYGDKVQQDVNVRGVMIQTNCGELNELLNGK